MARNGSSDYGICTATLIRDNWLLTAAHCVSGFDSIKFVSGQATAMANLAVIHPLYTGLNSIQCFGAPCRNINNGSDNDIALFTIT